MSLFSTILSIKETLTKEAFIQLVIDWNQGSPHSENIIPDIEWDGTRNIRYGNDNLWLQIEEYRNENIIAVRYEKIESDGVVWDTDYVMNFNDMKMSIRLERGYLEEALITSYAFSTPAFIQLLIDNDYLVDDGLMEVGRKPIFVSRDNLALIADVINGEARYQMPIVYISKCFDNRDPVDVWEMAKRLKGVAHVVVQENADTGFELRELTDSKNEYNGAVGIYFPNRTMGHRKFLRHDFPGSEKKLTEKTIARVIQYSTSQRLDKLYTWAGVSNALLRDRYSCKKDELADAEASKKLLEHTARLKSYEAQMRINSAEQSAESMKEYADEMAKLAKENEELVESVDEEMKDMKFQIENLTRQIDALTCENAGLRSKLDSLSDKPVLYLGEEDEFYVNEIKEFILMALTNELNKTEKNTRKADVLGDLINSNGGLQNFAKKRAETIKNILRGYKRLSSSMKRDLEELGFVIIKDGGHYKLRYYDDGRYVATLAATPSDHRTGDNIATDIIRIMF